jgi:hypothetical protein
MRVVARVLVSIAVSVLLLILLGAIYGLAHLPVFHSWGLAHGSFNMALPALLLASYVGLGRVSWFGTSIDFWPRILSGLSIFPLETVLFWINRKYDHQFSLAHLAIYSLLFLSLVILCLRATRPLQVPLFLLIPVLADPLFGFAIVGPYSQVRSVIFLNNILSEVLPVVIVLGSALVVVQVIRKRMAPGSSLG